MRQCMDSENLHRRLKKIAGQVQAIDRMIDEDEQKREKPDRKSDDKKAKKKDGGDTSCRR